MSIDASALQALRGTLALALRQAGESGEFDDGDSLFASGRLDSLALTQLVLYLEDHFQLDMGALDFSADLVDSVEAIQALLQSQPARLG